MNKLMIVAAAAAVSMVAGASDICFTPTTPHSVTVGQRVYDFKASVKMVDIKAGSSKGSSQDCFGKKSTYTIYDYYRVKSSRTFKGLFVDCDTCQVEATGTVSGDNLALSQATFFVASSKTKYNDIYEAITYGQSDNGYQVGLLNFFGGVTFAKSKNAEMSVALYFAEVEDNAGHERAYSLMAAGFGTRDSKEAFLNSVSGNVAGEVTTSFYCGYYGQAFEPCLETPFYAWVDDDSDSTTPDVQDTTAYTWQLARSPFYDAVTGTWSIKYNKSKSKLSDLPTLLKKTFGKNYTFMTSGAVTTFPFTVTFN